MGLEGSQPARGLSGDTLSSSTALPSAGRQSWSNGFTLGSFSDSIHGVLAGDQSRWAGESDSRVARGKGCPAEVAELADATDLKSVEP